MIDVKVWQNSSKTILFCQPHPIPQPESGLARAPLITGQIRFTNSPYSAFGLRLMSIYPKPQKFHLGMRPRSVNLVHEKGWKENYWFTFSKAIDLKWKRTQTVMIDTGKQDISIYYLTSQTLKKTYTTSVTFLRCVVF